MNLKAKASIQHWIQFLIYVVDNSMNHSINLKPLFYGILSHFQYFNMNEFTCLGGSLHFFHFYYIPFIGWHRDRLSSNNSSQYPRSPGCPLQNFVYKTVLALWKNQSFSFKFYDTEARSSSITIVRSRRGIQTPSQILVIYCWDI